jgi:hypothetical protein
MRPIAQGIMLALIAGSACCVLLGIIVTTIRAVKLARRQRRIEVEHKIWAYQRIKEANIIRSEKCEGGRDENVSSAEV